MPDLPNGMPHMAQADGEHAMPDPIDTEAQTVKWCSGSGTHGTGGSARKAYCRVCGRLIGMCLGSFRLARHQRKAAP